MTTKKLVDKTLSGPGHDNYEDDDQRARGYDAVAEL